MRTVLLYIMIDNLNVIRRMDYCCCKIVKSFFLLLCIGVLGTISSCKQTPPSIVFEFDLNQMDSVCERNVKEYYSIVCVDSTPNNLVYMNLLRKDFSKLLNKSVFNFVDVSLEKNQWYRQWLSFFRTPLTCVFSAENNSLIAVVDGASKNSFRKIEYALDNNRIEDGFCYLNSFKNVDNEKLISALNDILKSKQYMEQNLDFSIEVDNSLNVIRYPYNLYLKSISEMSLGNDSVASKYARELLDLTEPFYVENFENLYLKAKFVINPELELDDEPRLFINNAKIELNECEKNKTMLVQVELKNIGNKTLQINNVSPSCSCLELLGNWKCTIGCDESCVLSFKFTPDAKGEMFREIVIVSNAINAYEKIEILANVR